ncbi:uncharacterized protein Dvar_10000 [Desulfosarcina variabilis str. Montpellier]
MEGTREELMDNPDVKAAYFWPGNGELASSPDYLCWSAHSNPRNIAQILGTLGHFQL